jgi:hypothetical protein
MIFPMKMFPIAAVALVLAAWPVLAGPQVEAGDSLSPCTADTNTAKSDDASADQSGAQWGVEIASSFDKQQSLDAFASAKDKYSGILGDYSPTIVEVCDLSMGTDLRYSARIDLDDRDAADKLCNKLQAAGGACVVIKN